MSFHVYILRCSDGSYYVGHTDDLDRRIAQHRAGELPGYTQERRPVEFLWSADFGSRDEALTTERQIKGWSRAKKEALITGDWNAIQQFARRRTSFETGPRSRSAPPQDERKAEQADQRQNSFPPAVRAQEARKPRADQPPISPQAVRAEEARRPRADAPSPSTPAPAPPPVIVLVRPQLGENIGKTARAMLNFGLTELRLVAPRDGWPNPEAGPAAAGADMVLAGARLYDTLGDAVADCAHVYATTVRKRGVTKPVVTPEQAARAIRAEPGRSALVFGPERSGLETEEVALARTILTVPVNPDFGSLNLAQAVILAAYEWSKGADLAQPPRTELLPPAPQAELDGMIDQLEAMLDAAGYFFPPSRVTATKRTLRTLLTKPGWNALEVRTLRGVLSALANPRPRD